MKYKHIIGPVLCVVGVAAILYSVNAMRRIAAAKKDVGGITALFSGSTVGNMVGGKMRSETTKYDVAVEVIFIAGIAFVVVGAGVIFVRRRHKR